ncbi:MAG: right-handed parallel beta-helix repeat-containing protein [Chloroflexi bacterium]|nr:right-handed parallel beta-helix repeat-containing protein [Chloroflexota bacterium]
MTTNGSDANAGTQASPWRTLQKAANTLVAGQTVYIHAGTFDGFAMTRSGAADRPIRFIGYPGDARPIVTGSRVDIIRLSGIHDVTVEGLIIEGADGGAGRGAGIRIENGSSRLIVRNSLIRNNRSYGIAITGSTSITVGGTEITRNEEGVYIARSGEGIVIEGNRIHHQDKLVVNTAESENDDHGAVGIGLDRTTGRVLILNNQVWANRAPSYDYGWDGGAFEIYGASNVTIAGNRTWDNENVLETGTDGTSCQDNVFRHNVSYGATSRGRSFGMFIRCGDNMLVANNVFHNLDQFVFSVGGASLYNGSFEGLRIRNNIAVMAAGKIIGIESALPASVVINNNLMDNTSGGQVATVKGKGGTSSLATFASWTGYQRNGIDANPRFVGAASHDYRLSAGSPAIDTGVVLFGSSIPYAGSAPDLGRYETGTP